eukprot:14118751-Alexandrium_andersonii.AAC.1
MPLWPRSRRPPLPSVRRRCACCSLRCDCLLRRSAQPPCAARPTSRASVVAQRQDMGADTAHGAQQDEGPRGR